MQIAYEVTYEIRFFHVRSICGATARGQSPMGFEAAGFGGFAQAGVVARGDAVALCGAGEAASAFAV